MKNLFYSLSLMASAIYLTGCATSNGLRVNLDDYKFSTSYLQLPRNALDTAYHTFSVNVETGISSVLSGNKQAIAQQIEIAGWKKLNYDAHVQIKARFEDALIEASEVKEKIEWIKNAYGKDSIKNTSYYVEVTYSFASRASIKDYKEELISEIILADRQQKQVYQTKSFENAAEAKAYSKFGLLLLMGDLTKRATENAIVDLNNNLTYNYGFVEQTVTDIFWVLNSKNHPEYEAHRDAFVKFKKALNQLSCDGPLDYTRAELQPIIDYFNSVKKKYNTDDKGDRKLRYASCYNLSKIYYYLDDADAAMNEANELVMNGYDAKDGRYLEVVASDLKRLLRESKFRSRHFPINVDEFKGPEVLSKNDY